MNPSNLLLNNRHKVLQAFAKSEDDLEQDVASIKCWLKLQPHLPEMPADSLIQNFLVTNKFSVEKTKTKLDLYYSIRTVVPECFQNKNPKLTHMQDILKVVFYFPLPKLTNDLYRVNVTKITGDPKHFNAYNFFAHQLNVNEVRLHEEITLGDVLVIDIQDVSFGHFVKITPLHIRKVVYILEKVFSNRIKQIHFVNSSPCMDLLMTLLKSVLKQKLTERIHTHTSANSLLKFIPATILPKDYGGNEPSVEVFQELWKEKLEQYSARFDKLDVLKVNEKIRPALLRNDDILGYQGNFKSLSFD